MSHYTIHQDDDTSKPVHTYRWSLLKDGKKIGELYSQSDAETIRAALNGEQPQEVTRFEVIDAWGRTYTRRECAIELSYQDDGRTLKVFVTPPHASQSTADACSHSVALKSGRHVTCGACGKSMTFAKYLKRNAHTS